MKLYLLQFIKYFLQNKFWNYFEVILYYRAS